MATISSFRTALAAPQDHFATLKGIKCLDGNIVRSTYFAEAKVESAGQQMLIYMPLSAVSLRRVERLLPLKRHLTNSIVPQLTILREEMRCVDTLGRDSACDILCEPLPAGLPFVDALATVADDKETEQLMTALDELQARLSEANISHNNVCAENLLLDEDNHLSLIRWYYATEGAGGDSAAFDTLRTKIVSMSESLALHEPELNLYNVSQPLTGHLAVRFLKEGLAAVEHDTGWGFVDSENRFVVEPQYVWVSDFREGRAEVQTANGMGLIDKQGEYIIPPHYSIVEYDEVSGHSQALQGDGWITFDYDGLRLYELEEV